MAMGLERESTFAPGASAAATEAFISRLSVAFADPVRLKIITELFQREMSPSQFQTTFGGGSLEAICRQFKKLEQHGWLRLVRQEAPAGKARAERIYRAPELAVFDEGAWGLLPQTLKEEFSWRIFVQFAERVKWAFEAETIDARKDRHFTCTRLTLDERGRAVVFSVVTELFYSLLEEQRDAKLRLERSGETPIHATVGLCAFDSPAESGALSVLPRDSSEADLQRSRFFVRLSKILRHPANLRIINELNGREMSPSQFYREFGEQYDVDMRDLHRRFGNLAADGWIEICREDTGGKRRGATERFFRATGPAMFDTHGWLNVPQRYRERHTWRIFEQLATQVRDAMASRTFDRRDDRAHTWVALEFDQRGWKQVCAATNYVFNLIHEEQRKAAVRLGQVGAQTPELATVYLAVFESPKGAPSTPGVVDEPWVY